MTSLTPKGILRNKIIFNGQNNKSINNFPLTKSVNSFNSNDFAETNLSKNKYEDFFKFINDDIDLFSLKRPFSIKFREIKLKEPLESGVDTKDKMSVISIKCILMCGKDKFSNKRKIIWRGYGKNLTSAIINKRIYFETKYCDLPM